MKNSGSKSNLGNEECLNRKIKPIRMVNKYAKVCEKIKNSIEITELLLIPQIKYPQNKINTNRSATDKRPSFLNCNKADKLDRM